MTCSLDMLLDALSKGMSYLMKLVSSFKQKIVNRGFIAANPKEAVDLTILWTGQIVMLLGALNALGFYPVLFQLQWWEAVQALA